jgi:Tfp pilus assembly protein PilF
MPIIRLSITVGLLAVLLGCAPARPPAATLHTPSAPVLLAAGRAHLEAYEWDAAIAAFDAALAAQPDLHEAYYFRALAYASAPSPDGAALALADFTAYLAAAPEGPYAAAARRSRDVLQQALAAQSFGSTPPPQPRKAG